MRFVQALRRPQYVFNPVQALRRTRRFCGFEPELARLAWGLPIRLAGETFVETDIRNLGVYDLVVPEAIVRLLDPGELAVDAGGNVGQNACAMACRTGGRGRVVVFEPHPALSQILRENTTRWVHGDVAPIHVEQIALSRRAGRSLLYESDEFARNRGSASIERPGGVVASHEVATTTIDAYFPEATIGVLKLDVEGHEGAALEGAARALRERRIRDIVFEELRGLPADSSEILEAAGYEVFALFAPMRGPRVMAWREYETAPPRGSFTHDYLATLDPMRARTRFRPWGWRCLRARTLAG